MINPVETQEKLRVIIGKMVDKVSVVQTVGEDVIYITLDNKLLIITGVMHSVQVVDSG